jgi:hypothetical protein
MKFSLEKKKDIKHDDKLYVMIKLIMFIFSVKKKKN